MNPESNYSSINSSFPTGEEVRARVEEATIRRLDRLQPDLQPDAALTRALADPEFAAVFYRDQVLAMQLFEWLERRHRSVTEHFSNAIEEHMAARNEAAARAVEATHRADLAEDWMKQSAVKLKSLETELATVKGFHSIGEKLNTTLVQERQKAQDKAQRLTQTLQRLDEYFTEFLKTLTPAKRLAARRVLDRVFQS